MSTKCFNHFWTETLLASISWLTQHEAAGYGNTVPKFSCSSGVKLNGGTSFATRKKVSCLDTLPNSKLHNEIDTRIINNIIFSD